jgi:hypothetical protein
MVADRNDLTNYFMAWDTARANVQVSIIDVAYICTAHATCLNRDKYLALAWFWGLALDELQSSR